MRHAEPVILQTFYTRLEADVAKSVLNAAGIEAMILGDSDGGMREHLPGAGYRLLVRAEDAEAARDVLKLGWQEEGEG